MAIDDVVRLPTYLRPEVCVKGGCVLEAQYSHQHLGYVYRHRAVDGKVDTWQGDYGEELQQWLVSLHVTAIMGDVVTIKSEAAMARDSAAKDGIDVGGPTFKVGDVVRLISGGPMMTVTDTRYLDDGRVAVVWFHEGVANRDSMPVRALEAVTRG